jgi:hypothetical protein
MRLTDLLPLTELEFMGSICTKDCSGHAAGYKWSLDHGGKQPISHSRSFNNGAAIAGQKRAQRPQGGGKLQGYTSQTPSAVKRRQQRAAAKPTRPGQAPLPPQEQR